MTRVLEAERDEATRVFLIWATGSERGEQLVPCRRLDPKDRERLKQSKRVAVPP